MKLSEILNEAPISQFDIVGDFDAGHSFTEPERNLIRRHQQSLKPHKAFEKTPYDFKLFFLNTDHRDYAMKFNRSMVKGEPSVDNLSAKYGGTITRNTMIALDLPPEIDIYSGSITVLYLSNFGGDKVSMTPWILAHRFVHAIEDEAYRRKQNMVLAGLWDDFAKGVSILYYSYPFTMKSARSGNLTSEEMPMEVMSQYIINGKVSINHEKAIEIISDEFPSEINRNESSIVPWDLFDQPELFTKKWEANINLACKKILDLCVGEVFVAV